MEPAWGPEQGARSVCARRRCAKQSELAAGLKGPPLSAGEHVVLEISESWARTTKTTTRISARSSLIPKLALALALIAARHLAATAPAVERTA
jgi:hypothetical protein